MPYSHVILNRNVQHLECLSILFFGRCEPSSEDDEFHIVLWNPETKHPNRPERRVSHMNTRPSAPPDARMYLGFVFCLFGVREREKKNIYVRHTRTPRNTSHIFHVTTPIECHDLCTYVCVVCVCG